VSSTIRGMSGRKKTKQRKKITGDPMLREFLKFSHPIKGGMGPHGKSHCGTGRRGSGLFMPQVTSGGIKVLKTEKAGGEIPRKKKCTAKVSNGKHETIVHRLWGKADSRDSEGKEANKAWEETYCAERTVFSEIGGKKGKRKLAVSGRINSDKRNVGERGAC